MASDDEQQPPHGGAGEAAAPSTTALARPPAASPYPLSRLSPRFDLVDAAAEIARADTLIGTVVNARLQTIQKQIRALQDEARSILEEAQRSARMHRARSNFQKVPGRVYHLYRRPDGELYFSMLSPSEWAGSAPQGHGFEGSYRLGADMGWTRMDMDGPAADAAEGTTSDGPFEPEMPDADPGPIGAPGGWRGPPST